MNPMSTEFLFRGNFYTALYDSYIDLLVVFNDIFVTIVLVTILITHHMLNLPKWNAFHSTGVSIGIIGFAWQSILSASRYLEVDTLSIGWMMWSLKDFGVSIFLIGCIKAWLQRDKS